MTDPDATVVVAQVLGAVFVMLVVIGAATVAGVALATRAARDRERNVKQLAADLATYTERVRDLEHLPGELEKRLEQLDDVADTIERKRRRVAASASRAEAAVAEPPPPATPEDELRAIRERWRARNGGAA